MSAADGEITWEEIHQAFASFAGSCLYSIRADIFFHLTARESPSARLVITNLVYSLWPPSRARQTALQRSGKTSGTFVFVCDRAGEAGWGTLRPLLRSAPMSATLAVNSHVLQERGRELRAIAGVNVIDADSFPHDPWRLQWQRAQSDFRALLTSCPPRLRRRFNASRLVIWALLFRAYRYQRFFTSLLARGPAAVITHNDFTSLNYLAGEAARRAHIPDFTLQHGFVGPEYFPPSARHYLVWGQATAAYMKHHSPGSPTTFVPVGAPRLDALAFLPEGHQQAKTVLEDLGLRDPDRLNLLFLSQSHSPTFSRLEHNWVLALVAELAAAPEFHLVVRRHPQESSRLFRQHRALARAPVVPKNLSLIEAVLGSDVVISVNSTAMLEAALLRTPVVQISPARFGDRMGMLRFPRTVASAEAAKAVLLALRQPQERDLCLAEQQSVMEAHFGQPGLATNIAWTYIQQTAAAHRKLSATAGK